LDAGAGHPLLLGWHGANMEITMVFVRWILLLVCEAATWFKPHGGR
jgi:hypothetical protein